MQLLDLQNLPDTRLLDLERQLQLYEQLNEDEGIHGLIKKAATLFCNPVTLLDPDLRLITRAAVTDDHPAVCESLASTGTCRSDCRSCFTDQAVREAVQAATAAIYVERTGKAPLGRIFAKVSWGERILAYLLIFQCQGDLNTRGGLELAATLAKIIAIMMRQRPVVTLFEEGEPGALLASILSGQQISAAMIAERTARMSQGDKLWYQLLYLPSLQRNNEFFSIDYFAKQLEELGRKPHYLFKDGAYLLVFTAAEALDFRGLDHELKLVLSASDLQASLSERFSSLTDLPGQLDICELLYDYAQMRDPKSVLHRLGTHIIGLLMHGKLISGDMRLIHPDIALLHDYDEDNNSQLLLSWTTYLKAHKHLNNAAELLGIHKNTLVYRVKKIQELTVGLGDENDSISYQLLSHEKLMSADK